MVCARTLSDALSLNTLRLFTESGAYIYLANLTALAVCHLSGLMMEPNVIATGTYRLVHAHSGNYAAMRKKEDGATVFSTTNVFPDEDLTYWRVMRHDNNQYSLLNSATSLYARSEFRPSAGAIGAEYECLWTIRETPVKEQFTVMTVDSRHFWGLKDKEMQSAVTVFDSFQRPWTQWKFQEVQSSRPPSEWPQPRSRVSGMIAIRNKGRSMQVTSNNGLVFSDRHRGMDTWFNVRPLEGSRIALIGHNGLHVNLTTRNAIACSGAVQGASFSIVHQSANQVYFTVSTTDGPNESANSLFLSSTASDAESLTLKTKEDETCYFEIEEIPWTDTGSAVINGVIALSHDFNGERRYLKVDNRMGLSFVAGLDNDARFIVQHRGDRMCLIGNNGCHLSMTGAYVKCDGEGQGVLFRFFYQSTSSLYFTISERYDGKDGQTYYLSRNAGNGGADSLAVLKDGLREECVFTVENLV